jgi:hypothetical protein
LNAPGFLSVVSATIATRLPSATATASASIVFIGILL